MTYEVVKAFTVKTNKGELNLHPKQTITLKEEKATILIAEGKIKPLSTPDQFKEVFDSAVKDIAKQYIPDAIQYSRKVFPMTYQKGMKAEDRLNRLWNEGADLNTFKLAVKEWKEIELALIKLFRKEN